MYRKPAVCMSLFASMVLLVSCIPTHIKSTKSGDPITQPTRLFVLTDIGSEYGPGFGDGFRVKMANILRECGTQVDWSFVETKLKVGKLDNLKLDSDAKRKLNQFNPDKFLKIQITGGQLSTTGVLFDPFYDIKLYDFQLQKVVWSASLKLGFTEVHADDRAWGEEFAIDLTNKMKEDGIWTSCPIVKK